MPLELRASEAMARRIGNAVPAGSTPDVVCVHLPEIDLERIRAIAEEAADRATILVVDEMPTPYLTRILLARFQAIVLADELETTLPVALLAIAAGLRVNPKGFAESLTAPALSAREKQILAMVILDFSNAQIAGKLHVSESNVKFHLSSAFAKMGVRSRSAAAALILDRDAGMGLGILRITDVGDDQL